MISRCWQRVAGFLLDRRISWHMRLCDYYETKDDHAAMLSHWETASALIAERSRQS